MGAEVLPVKNKVAVDRLRRRFDGYRKHQTECVPRFNQSFNGLVEQNVQETLVLRQRYLESKAKRAAKKTDKKQNDGPTSQAGQPGQAAPGSQQPPQPSQPGGLGVSTTRGCAPPGGWGQVCPGLEGVERRGPRLGVAGRDAGQQGHASAEPSPIAFEVHVTSARVP